MIAVSLTVIIVIIAIAVLIGVAVVVIIAVVCYRRRRRGEMMYTLENCLWWLIGRIELIRQKGAKTILGSNSLNLSLMDWFFGTRLH